MPDHLTIAELIKAARIPYKALDCLDLDELGDALFFADAFRGQVLFDISERAWYVRDGPHWLKDRGGRVYGLVSKDIAANYDQAATAERQEGHAELSHKLRQRARHLRGRNRIERVLDLAAKEEGLWVDAPDWRIPPMVLPVENGVVDLTTGECRDATDWDRFRIVAPTPWRGLHYPASRWQQFLEQVFGGDGDLIAFVQRLLGYAITGAFTEQVLAILWGGGANGKSTLIHAVSLVLGRQLAFTTQSDSLMDHGRTDGEGARPYLAALENARLVWATETSESDRFRTGLIKQLTGDYDLTARTIYSEQRTFEQQHTIFMTTNHRPKMPAGEDQALWRRLLLIRFTQQFVDEPNGPNEHARDRDLMKRLREELPGILSWLVRGCLAWQKEGLNPPASVRESTAQYRRDEDLLGQFIADCLTRGEGLSVLAGDLYRRYVQWCAENGFRAVSNKVFGQRMCAEYGESSMVRRGGIVARAYSGVDIASGG